MKVDPAGSGARPPAPRPERGPPFELPGRMRYLPDAAPGDEEAPTPPRAGDVRRPEPASSASPAAPARPDGPRPADGPAAPDPTSASRPLARPPAARSRAPEGGQLPANHPPLPSASHGPRAAGAVASPVALFKGAPASGPTSLVAAALAAPRASAAVIARPLQAQLRAARFGPEGVARLVIETEALGKVHVTLELVGGELHVWLRAVDQADEQRLRARRHEVLEALEAAELVHGRVVLRDGPPPHERDRDTDTQRKR